MSEEAEELKRAIKAFKKRLKLYRQDDESNISGKSKLTNGKPSTVKLRLKELVEKGYLVPKGQGRGAHYVRRSK